MEMAHAIHHSVSGNELQSLIRLSLKVDSASTVLGLPTSERGSREEGQ